MRGEWRRITVELRGLAAAFLDLCLPRYCEGCGRAISASEPSGWCPECWEMLPWIRSPLCPRCGRPYLKSPTSPDHLCGKCLLAPPLLGWIRSAVAHSGIARDCIHSLKFGGELHRVPPLIPLLAVAAEHGLPALPFPDFILPVPLHIKRLRQRGFNQSALLARSLGRRIHLPVRFDVLTRKVWTEPQTRLSREDRLINVKGAFSVPRPAAVTEKAILLVDDVFTTGSTLAECAKVLKKAGAAEVYAVTVSRALPERAVKDRWSGEELAPPPSRGGGWGVGEKSKSAR